MTVTPRERRCYYCGQTGATFAWRCLSLHRLVWTCADQHACTARARVLAANRVSESDAA